MAGPRLCSLWCCTPVATPRQWCAGTGASAFCTQQAPMGLSFTLQRPMCALSAPLSLCRRTMARAGSSRPASSGASCPPSAPHRRRPRPRRRRPRLREKASPGGPLPAGAPRARRLAAVAMHAGICQRRPGTLDGRECMHAWRYRHFCKTLRGAPSPLLWKVWGGPGVEFLKDVNSAGLGGPHR